jgi:cell shape-determining protein MreC
MEAEKHKHTKLHSEGLLLQHSKVQKLCVCLSHTLCCSRIFFLLSNQQNPLWDLPSSTNILTKSQQFRTQLKHRMSAGINHHVKTSSQAQKNHHVNNKWPQQQQFQSKIKSFKESCQSFEENFKTNHVKAP